MINSRVAFFVDKFWIQDKIRDPKRQTLLPLTDLSDYNYWNIPGEKTRLYTVEIYTEEVVGTPVLVASDDGNGYIVAIDDDILEEGTGENNTVDYVNNLVTLTWNSTFLSGLTNQPFIYFKLLFDDESFEHHAELRDFLTFALEKYKTDELDVYKKYYNPDQIPSHLFDDFAQAHGWTIDRVFSEEESYIRLQLKSIYNFYRNKRKEIGIQWAVRLINKTVGIYNLLARRGSTEQETTNNYNNFSDYIRFRHDELLELGSSDTGGDPEAVETIFESIFSELSTWFPTKHFLLDLALNVINDDSSLLKAVDISTLRFYTQIVRSKTQYPHFTATLGINSQIGLTEQDGTQFDFYLRPEESQFYINNFESVWAGPNGVYSIAMDGSGSWAVLPLMLNTRYSMNTGLLANMDITDLGGSGGLISSFKIGTGSHAVLTNELTDLDESILTSTNIEYRSEGETSYFVCTVGINEAYDEDITELGLFNGGGDLAFYAKFPIISKTDKHTLTFKIKIDTVDQTG